MRLKAPLCACKRYMVAVIMIDIAVQTLPDLTQTASLGPLEARAGTLVTVAQKALGIAVPDKEALSHMDSDL